MFEIMIRFPDFKIENASESINVRPVYPHIHLKDGVTTSSLADLKDGDIAAPHLKTGSRLLHTNCGPRNMEPFLIASPLTLMPRQFQSSRTLT